MKRLWIFDTDAANDATAATLLARLRRFTAYPIESLRSCQIYGVDTAANDSAADDTAADDTAAIDAALQHSDGERIRRENIDWQRVGALLFADRVTQHCLTQLDPQGPLPFDHCIEVRYQEGVTDPLGQAAQAALETYLRAHAPTVPPPQDGLQRAGIPRAGCALAQSDRSTGRRMARQPGHRTDHLPQQG